MYVFIPYHIVYIDRKGKRHAIDSADNDISLTVLLVSHYKAL